MIPRAFCEFPAGLASVSLRLHGGSKCRPPISRMGNKAGYAEAILWTLGLTAGKSASAYVWAEADDDVRALLQAYPDPAMLLRIAEIIRGWADEEPRALWERLRAERKARVGAEGVARHLQLAGSNRLIPGGFAADGRWVNAARDGGPETLGGASFGGNEFATSATATATATATLANFAMLASSNRLINVAGPDLMNTGNGGTRFGGDFATPAGEVADKFERVAGEVAAHSFLHQGSFGHKGEDAGIDTRPERQGSIVEILRDSFPRIVSNWPFVAVLPRIPSGADLSALLGTPGDLEGVVVYMDPPYLNTTGYLHDLGRGAVIGHALDLSGMGATVAISEAEAIPELVAAGWYVADLTAGRKGQKRTFSKQQGEYLTMTSEPRYTIPEQVGLFGTP